MVDERTNLTQQVIAEVRAHFKEKVFETQVPRSVRLAEAPSFGQPVILYDIRSRGAEAYLELARELMSHGPAAVVRAVSGRQAPGARPRAGGPDPRAGARGRRGAASAEVALDLARPEPLPAAAGWTPAAGGIGGLDPRERLVHPILVGGAESATRSSRARGAGARPQAAGLASVPVIVRDVPDEQLLELALVENVQREELGRSRRRRRSTVCRASSG